MKFEEYLSSLRGKSVAVIGIGVSNQPLIRLLLDRGIQVTACDKKSREALGALGGAVIWCLRFVERQKQQDREIAAIRKEQTLICYGILACLKGLKEQGCNGPVSAALDKMEKHLNQAAHEGEES